MTVRCDACGTENRDKAMFCLGCAGKLPAFAVTKRPPADGYGPGRVASPASGASMPPSGPARSFSIAIGVRIALCMLLLVVLGASVVWFTGTSTGSVPQAPSPPQLSVSEEPLSAESSLSEGETLDKAGPRNPSPEVAAVDVEPPAPVRGTGRKPAAAVSGGGRASDPRIGCEHLFFAFAARCEANHCQQPAHARHPRCDVVREQRRRDDARRDSMPTS